jgi:hypothetical protein
MAFEDQLASLRGGRKRDIQDNHYLNTHCSRHRAASPVSPASTSLRRPGAAELGR